MGRLFWKFFFCIWLAQLTAIGAVSVIFWIERQQDHARWEAAQAAGIAVPERHDWRHRPPEPPGLGGAPALQSRPHFPPPRRLPLIPLVVTLFASLIFAALLARYVSKPIGKLRAAFAAAATGDLEARVGEDMGKRRDELADLGHDFDRMASQLGALMEAQRRLMHDVSHELRSPLARLQAALGLLRQRPERLEATIERIEREGVRMDRLVGELLTLSRLEAGVTGAMDEPVALGELLTDIVEDARFEADGLGREVALSLSADGLVRGNGELLHRAVENVVRNALRHTAVGTGIAVEASREGGVFRIAILDHGPGISEAKLEAIFEPFFRADDASGEGHGLGLTIARRVVEAHGGSIRASNRADGGLKVEIALPAA
ncbi:MAG: ATP-binding protein [Betaproteobacteria bacterium]